MADFDQNGLMERIRFRGRPEGNPECMLVHGGARFTVLTPRLLRMEWSEAGSFDDRGTYAFPSRWAPAPKFRHRVSDGALLIETGALGLRYLPDGQPFGPANLAVSFPLGGEAHTWRPGEVDPLNLRGTRRTLDGCEGEAALEEGLLSRSGWSLFDDSRSVRFGTQDGWVAPPPAPPYRDWVLFAYGHNYKLALAEYCQFGGPVPLLPRFVLGAWWSRYWAYSAQDLQDLVHEFEANGLPLDVLVIDMDWHTPHAWTGYTWNRDLFPDPLAFMRWVHAKGLKATLNLHPAQGVQQFEEVYPSFARSLGLDPASGAAVPFRITDKRFVRSYFEILHHPMEDEGVDFWWVDWQQGERSEMPGLDPLPWLNHLHYSDSRRRGLRPMLFSRWGGLGNHRYPIGFSGDTLVTWSALQFQPYLTATAANVAFGWWSHDIGGHMGGATEPELFARWVQFGALSPVLRLHATKDPRAERRPWKYPYPVLQVARDAFRLRYHLIPYLYTLARTAADTGIGPCRPMYYEHPEEEAAYAARSQYYLGEQIIAAPIVHPASPHTGFASADVWIPPGTWIDYTTKETFDGPAWIRVVGDLRRIPLFVRAGAILPLAPPFELESASVMVSGCTGAIPAHTLAVSVFPGEAASYSLYEDDGCSETYLQGEAETTPIVAHMDSPSRLELTLGPVQGRCPALPSERAYELRLEGTHRPDEVHIDGEPASDWSHDPDRLVTTIVVPRHDKRKAVHVAAASRRGLSALGERHNCACVVSDLRALLSSDLPQVADRQALVDAALEGRGPGWLDAIARAGGPLLRFVEYTTPEDARRRLGSLVVGAPRFSQPDFSLDVTWLLSRGASVERHAVRIPHTTHSLVIDAPFSFDGCVRPTRWQANAALTWCGRTLELGYTSQVLFPSITAWQVELHEHPLSLSDLPAGGRDAHTMEGHRGQALVQDAHGATNLRQPFVVRLSEGGVGQAGSARPAAAWLTTEVVCPAEREAILLFHAAGSITVFLEGKRLETQPSDRHDAMAPIFWGGRQTQPVKLRLGRNRLTVVTQPPATARQAWALAGAIATRAYEPMPDLAYEISASGAGSGP